jgi:phosphatidate cytidylyltransferase
LNNFYTRTLTGAGIVLFILGGFWLHPYTFFAAGLILLTGCVYEYFQIIIGTGAKPQVATGLIISAYLYTASTLIARGSAGFRLFIILLAFIPAAIIMEIFRKQQNPFNNLAQTVFPVLYIALPFSLFPFSAWNHEGLKTILGNDTFLFSPALVIGFFILIWANDTGAYLTGVTMGRHKLLERISPKKTWEGLAGGLLLSVVAGFFLPDLIGITGKAGWIIAALITGVAGTFGDLAESMLKRSAGVKDSGSILPGHGGFLDRFDSTIMAFPLVYLFVTLFGRF